MSGICGFIDLNNKFNSDYIVNVINSMNSALYTPSEEYL